MIVQLGTETHTLQHRIEAAKDQLGDIVHAEWTAFFVMLESFLSQFDVWTNYISDSRGADGSGSAREVLAAALSEEGFLTARARARIADYIEGADLNGSSKDLKGTTRSAENLLSSAVGDIVQEAREESTELATAIKSKLRDQAATGISGFIARNTAPILQFAKENALKWLEDIFNDVP